MQRRRGLRVLIFNQQGDRDALNLLEHLYKSVENDEANDSDCDEPENVRKHKFDWVIFCPPVHDNDATKKGKFGLAAVSISSV